MIQYREARHDDGPNIPLLRQAIDRGASCAVDEDGPICLWGFIPDAILGDKVFMWFYPLRELCRYRTRFLRENRRYLAKVLETYPVIYGSVDKDLPQARRWLLWLGFKIIGVFEHDGKSFESLELRRA